MTDSYVCIDLETTGLDPKRDKIIEIGAVKVEQNTIVEEWETFVNPDRKLEERIVELTGICDGQLADAPQMEEVFAVEKQTERTSCRLFLTHQLQKYPQK